MPRNPKALTKTQLKLFDYFYKTHKDKWFTPWDVPRTIVSNAYSGPLKGMVKKGYLIELNGRYKISGTKL